MTSGQISNYATTFLSKRDASSRSSRNDAHTPSSCFVENVGEISVKSRNNEDHSRSRWNKASMGQHDSAGPRSGTTCRTSQKHRTRPRALTHEPRSVCNRSKTTSSKTQKLIPCWNTQPCATSFQKEFEERLKPNRAPAARSARQRWSCSQCTCGSPDPTRPHVLWLCSERLLYIAESAVRKRFR